MAQALNKGECLKYELRNLLTVVIYSSFIMIAPPIKSGEWWKIFIPDLSKRRSYSFPTLTLQGFNSLEKSHFDQRRDK